MTPKELDDFIEHGEKHISHFIIVFGEEWVRHAIQIASELRHRLKHHERKWVGLTDEEVKAAWSELWYDLGNGKFAASDDPSRHTTVMFAKAIEAKLKEKNGD